MSERTYLMSRIAKGLPSALRNIPKGGDFANPYIATRVTAHDVGRRAATSMARHNQTEQKIAATYNKKKRHLLVGQMRGLTDPLERFYQGQMLKEARARTGNVVREGKAWRARSHDRLAGAQRQGQLVRLPTRPEYARAA